MKSERSEHYLKLLSFLGRRLQSSKPINDPSYSPRTRQLFEFAKKRLEKLKPRVNRVVNIIPLERQGKIEKEIWIEDVEVIIGHIHLAIGVKVRET